MRERRTGPVIHFILLIVCAVAIYLSCEWFVNAVEWLGERLNVGKMAVGTILAAFGTALPESVVTLVAVTTGDTPEAKNIGVGAAMGGPLALATVAYGVTGGMLLVKRHRERMTILADTGMPSSDPAKAPGREAVGEPKDMKRLAKDQKWFLPIFIVQVTLGLVAFAFKPALGLAFFAAYAVYFWREIRSKGDEEDGEEDLEPLKFQPKAASPATWAVVAQTLATLVVIFVASQYFVKTTRRHRPHAGPVHRSDRTTALPRGDRTARGDERDHLGASGQDEAGAGEHLRRHDDPGHRAQRTRLPLHRLGLRRRTAVVRADHHGRDPLPAGHHARPQTHPRPPDRRRRLLRRLRHRTDLDGLSSSSRLPPPLAGTGGLPAIAHCALHPPSRPPHAPPARVTDHVGSLNPRGLTNLIPHNAWVGEVAHIRGAEPGSARYDAAFAKDTDRLRAFDNLVLLCRVHHRRIDDPASGIATAWNS